jgi:hypothetical protein
MKFSSAILAISLLSPLAAQADGWVARVSCNGGEIAVDSLENFGGLRQNQIVIRNGDAVRYFNGLSGNVLKPNLRGELIASPAEFHDDGSATGQLQDVPNGSSTIRYFLDGHFGGEGTYDISLTRLSMYPGMTNPHPDTVGSWTFRGCARLK